MLQAFRNALVIPDLRNKLLITLGLLAAYRLMVHIPTPGVDIDALQGGALSSDIFSLLNFISGGNFEVFSIAALGVIPYITASIIIQLLTSTYPPLEKLSKERQPLYEEAHIHVKSGNGAHHQVVESIIEALAAHLGEH